MTVKYIDLGIVKNTEVKIISINGHEVSVKQYLPVDKKAGIIDLSTRGSIAEGVVNETLMEAYLHVFMVEHYTDIEFEENDSFDLFDIYDQLHSSGTLDIIVQAMDPVEYEYIFDTAARAMNSLNAFSRSSAATLLNAMKTD
jgi:hypothetical protein